jgi:tetrathionate reductase subunit A
MSFQALARKTVKGVMDNKLNLAIIDPLMQGGTDVPGKTKWIPIKPSTDGALVMGMMHWIFDNKKYNEKFLECPNIEAAESIGYKSYTNAGHLVIVDENHPNNRSFLRSEDLGLEGEDFYVIDKNTGKLELNHKVSAAELFYNGEIEGKDGKIKVATSLYLLNQGVRRHSIEEYAEICGIPSIEIEALAKEFASHGHKVAVDTLGGTNSTNALPFTVALWLLPALMGSYNMKGGMAISGPSFKAFAEGPKYDLSTFEGQVKPSGVKISREQFHYENTTEYKNKMEQGKNPYPSKLPWHTNGMSLDGQAMFSALNKYPYQCKILVNCFANPMYGTPGLYQETMIEEIKKTSNIPLIISVDIAMGETTAFADYIVPDTSVYEQWAMVPVRANINTQMTAVRYPIIEPATPKVGTSNQPISMETYLIEVAKKIEMPGFGDDAIKDADGKLWPLNTREDYFMKAVANMAYDGDVVGDISEEDNKITGLDSIPKDWEEAVKADELSAVKNIIAKGGKFESDTNCHDGEFMKYVSPDKICFYSENLANSKNSITGSYNEGSPVWIPEVLADGTLVNEVYSSEEYPFSICSSKSKLRGISMLNNCPTLQVLSDKNYIEINVLDANELGLKDGQKVRIESPTNEAEGVLKIKEGVSRGTLGISFGYGKWEYGSKDATIDGKVVEGEAIRSAGTATNPLSMADKSVGEKYGLSDVVSGTHNRSGIRAKIVQIG